MKDRGFVALKFESGEKNLRLTLLALRDLQEVTGLADISEVLSHSLADAKFVTEAVKCGLVGSGAAKDSAEAEKALKTLAEPSYVALTTKVAEAISLCINGVEPPPENPRKAVPLTSTSSEGPPSDQD